MLPDEKIMCHRTGFEKSCFDMVTRCKCRLWRGVEGEDPQTKKPLGIFWDCADSTMMTLAMQQGSLQTQTIASTDKVANEVKAQRDESVALGAIGIQRLRDEVRNIIPLLSGPTGNGQALIGSD